MADQDFSAPSGARSGVPATVPSSGVVHVRYRHTEHFVVIGNHLAQHDKLSLTARGLALYILSLPDGVRIGIKFLVAQFKEGEVLIASCLRELEEHGYLVRTKERISGNRWVTRTLAYDMPPLPAAVLRPEGTRRPTRQAVHAPAPDPAGVSVSVSAAEPGPPTQEARPAHAPSDSAAQPPEPSAVGPTVPSRPSVPLPEPGNYDAARHRVASDLLAGLRRLDPRLVLSARDIARLAPAVSAWLEREMAPVDVERALTTRLPVAPLVYPAAFLGRRLTELLPPPLPAVRDVARARTMPLQNCDACDRAFRAPEPGECRECRLVETSPGPAAVAA
jgi:hypothetical protein